MEVILSVPSDAGCTDAPTSEESGRPVRICGGADSDIVVSSGGTILKMLRPDDDCGIPEVLDTVHGTAARRSGVLMTATDAPVLVDPRMFLEVVRELAFDAALALTVSPEIAENGDGYAVDAGGMVVRGAGRRHGTFRDAGLCYHSASLLATRPPTCRSILKRSAHPATVNPGIMGVPLPVIPPCGETARKAMFLDRDGIVNRDTGYPYLPGHIEFNPGIFPLCRHARDRGYDIVIITNQAGVAKGKFTVGDVEALHRWMAGEFERRGIGILGALYCPYHERGSVAEFALPSLYRKPEPGLVLEAAEKWNIDLRRSLMVGDKESDRIRLPYFKSYVVKSRYVCAGFDFPTLEAVVQALAE